MARTEAGATLTAEHHRAQTQLRAQALRDYLALWPIWRGDEESFNTLVAATIPLIRTYHRLSATIAGAYFDSYRRAERAGGESPPRLAAPLEPGRLVASLNVTGRVQTVKAVRAGQPLDRAMQTALIRTSGAVARHVQNGGRDTITASVREDRQALGWARILGPSPCPFCLTLASRGAVYKEQTVGFEAHDHCNCTGAPVYDGDPQPVAARALSVYQAAQRWARENPDRAPAGTANDAVNNVRRFMARSETSAHTG